ncbi:hypothetical protein LTR10_020987 [Elasticomyces elasticus]|uniref:Uncharacterized protein n=1 Tax=Exophiala sideris TaxID=1016849 RepID=A0ABR0JLL0_9EURO|nr:hypothetical protein LTR10_020987 [Elasticomyces elasticus]KAK5036496.1 hypothetical protein LTS07_002223 [Exophiala sideris]KAK5041675.1 hypothetical protein LTR13_002342 [Exophiala sideris]KAK5066879.1 hypothetical protein LTR69_002227 [Exophiala sideris]KAK5184938.1 hypothetical protein LTR44_002784 [Eurotiomycetes sp. CCFEE 6388]
MTSTNDPNLPKFIQAMESIYGPLPSPTDPKPSTWTPPETAEGHRGRYLWTDGFAVVNFLTLHRTTNDSRYLTFAMNLVTTVHNILGYTRDGNHRLPGATDDHPLNGGLRIGKHDDAGPDSDGQYFHYLTVWMFALNRMSLVTNDKWYNEQAVSLAKAVLPHFMTNTSSARPRMYWKLSTDLSHPLVESEGNLDPIDGLPTVQDEIALLKKILDTKWRDYSSSDTLDLGMTLWTAHWLVSEEAWAATLSRRAVHCLKTLVQHGHFEESTRRRLAFREFGTALGLRAAFRISSETNSDDELAAIKHLPDQICKVWEDVGLVPVPTKQQQGRMAELLPITAVMYASALIPGMMCQQ